MGDRNAHADQGAPRKPRRKRAHKEALDDSTFMKSMVDP